MLEFVVFAKENFNKLIMLTVCWLYVDCMLTVRWLYVDCTLIVFWAFVGQVANVCRIASGIFIYSRAPPKPIEMPCGMERCRLNSQRMTCIMSWAWVCSSPGRFLPVCLSRRSCWEGIRPTDTTCKTKCESSCVHYCMCVSHSPESWSNTFLLEEDCAPQHSAELT